MTMLWHYFNLYFGLWVVALANVESCIIRRHFCYLIQFLLPSTSLKILSGGWVPILIGAVLYTILMTWKDGRALVLKRLEKDSLPIDLFIKSISMGSETKFVPGDAVFLTGTPNIVPHAMLHNIKHNKSPA